MRAVGTVRTVGAMRTVGPMRAVRTMRSMRAVLRGKRRIVWIPHNLSVACIARAVDAPVFVLRKHAPGTSFVPGGSLAL